MYVIVVEAELIEGCTSPVFCARKNRKIPAGFANAGSVYTSSQQVLLDILDLGATSVCLDYLVEDQALYAFLHRRLRKNGVAVRGIDPLSVDWDPKVIALGLGYTYDERAVVTHRLMLEAEGKTCRINGKSRPLANGKFRERDPRPVLENLMRLSKSEIGLVLEFSGDVICSIGPESLRTWPAVTDTKAWTLPATHNWFLSQMFPQRLKNTQDLRDQMWTAEYLEDDPEYPQELVWESPTEFKNCDIWGFLHQGIPVAFAAVDGQMLKNVRVLPAFRGRRLGQELVNCVVKQGVTSLQCRESLVTWYEDLGFIRTGGGNPLFQRMSKK